MTITELQAGKTYLVNSDRKGTFAGKYLSGDDTWATFEITSGKAKAMLKYNEREKGEEVTVRKSFCKFTETAAPVDQPTGNTAQPAAAVSTSEREALIARLREWTAENDPVVLMEQAADMHEADAVPPGYGWLTACDEEMICYHLGVANLSDSYESAKRKLRALIDLNVAIATDPAVNGGMSLQPAVPQEPVAYSVGNTLLWHIGKGLFNAQLYASPIQWPRLTDGEIEEICWTELDNRMLSFARDIEKKVRGEA